jgi:hypothetical protein
MADKLLKVKHTADNAQPVLEGTVQMPRQPEKK